MTSILTVTLNPAVDISGETETVEHTRKVRTRNDRFDPGGGGINVARVIAMFGGEVEALFLSGGEMGALLARLVEEKGVRHRALPIAGQTRVSFTARELGSGHEYRFVQQGPTVTSEALDRVLDAVGAHDGGFVIASGSLPAGCSPDIYARMADRVAGRGIRFVLDSSGEGLRAAIERASVFLLKPNLTELEQLAGEKLDEEGAGRVAAKLVERGTAQFIAVTLGADGALLASADGILRVPAIRVKESSAVGAGDSFLGAMVWALASGWPAAEALKFGVAAGAAAIMTPGTELCRREDTLALYDGIKAG
jgi:6-phosphofructokinase 2